MGRARERSADFAASQKDIRENIYWNLKSCDVIVSISTVIGHSIPSDEKS